MRVMNKTINKKIMSQNYEVDTLYTICIRKVVRCIDSWCKLAKDLPCVVKDEILRLVALRDKLNERNLRYLVHPQLSRLDLGSCVLTNEVLETVKMCRSLEELRLSTSCASAGPELDPSVLADVFTTLHKLQSLTLARLQSVTDDVIETVSFNCPLLAMLDVGGCVAISNASLEAVKNLKHLYALNISHTKVTDEGMLPYLEECGSQLTELHLNGCSKLTEETSKAVSAYCNNLKYFSSELGGGDCALKNLEYFAWNIS